MLTRVLETALPVFIALFLGILCRKKQMLTRSGVDALKKVAVDIALPAEILMAFAGTQYSIGGMRIPVMMFAVCLAALFLGRLLRKALRIRSTRMPYLMTGFEAGMMGYGLYALLHPDGMADFAILDLGQVLFVFTVFKLSISGKGKGTQIFREAFSSPVLWAIIIGVILGATGIYEALKPSGVSAVLESVTDFIAAPAGCLILLTVGYDLELKGIHWSRVLTYTGSRILIMGALGGLVWLLNTTVLGGAIRPGALILMMSLPAPFLIPVFADVEEEKSDIASTLSVMTLFCLAVFAVLAAAGL
ncbi:MAG: hypothetical protein Q4G19_01495 [Clostridia bacterium]|nr:hypothetical protein [Clostridia bacterium]